VLLDSTGMNVEEVTQAVLDIVTEKLK
jgi:hypothetical protein